MSDHLSDKEIRSDYLARLRGPRCSRLCVPGAVYRCDWDAHLTMRFVTDAIEDITGYPAGELINNKVRSFASLVHPGDAMALEENLAAAIEADEPFRVEFRILDPEGQERWVCNRGQAIRDRSGALLYLDGIILDLTDSKQHEHEILRAQYAVDDAIDAVLVVERDGGISYVNMAFGDLFRCTRDAVGEVRFGSLFANPDAAVEDLACVFDGEVWIGEMEMVTREGRRFPAEVRATPVRDSGDSCTGMLLMIQDISGRKEAEEEARRMNHILEHRVAERTAELDRANRELQREIIKHMYTEEALERTTGMLNSILTSSTEFAIMATDLQFRILHFNPAAERVFGFEAQEVIGRTVHEMHTRAGVGLDRFREAVAAVNEEGKYEFEYDVDAAPGNRRCIHVVLMAMRDERGTCKGYILFATDVTERRHSEAELAGYRDRLEDLVRGRTIELAKANEELQNEIAERRQAEEATRESKRLLQHVFDAINDGICVLDRDMRIVRINSWMRSRWADREYGSGDICHEVYWDRDTPCDECVCVKAMETGASKRSVRRVVYPSGQAAWIDVSAFPLRDGDGRIMGVIQHVKDITESRQAQDELNEQTELLSNVLSNIPHLVFWKDQDLRYLGCNHALARVAGLSSPEEIVGKSDADLPWGPTEGEAYRDVDKMVLRSGEAILDLEESQHQVDGREAILLTSRVPLRDSSGQLTGILGMSTDVTERKHIEQELLRTQTALDDAGDAILVMRPDRTITYINMSFTDLFRCTLEMINENGFGSIWVDTSVGEEILAAIEAGDSWSGEAEMVSREGHRFPADVRATPIIDERVLIAGMLLMVNDITERKLLESRVLQTRKLESIGQLAAGIAHEINTPTQYIGDNTHFLKDGFTDLAELLGKYNELVETVKSGADGAAKVAEIERAIQEIELDYLREEIPSAISQAIDGIERVSEIVRAMKEFSHPGVEGMTNVDINNAIQSTITVARNEWKYVADMVTEYDGSLPSVPCLAGEFNQVILNLIVNAAHAIEDVVGDGVEGKGTITVRTKRVDEWAEVQVQDTGAGIPAPIRQRIFDPFFTTKEVGRGTGQGLSMAHDVVVGKHGGTIDVETEIGQGTTFTLRLPLKGKLTEGVEANEV